VASARRETKLGRPWLEMDWWGTQRRQGGQRRMEPLWSPVVATAGKRSQSAKPKKPQTQAKTVAVCCDRLPEKFHGKEGVDGSRLSEGFEKGPQLALFGTCESADRRCRLPTTCPQDLSPALRRLYVLGLNRTLRQRGVPPCDGGASAPRNNDEASRISVRSCAARMSRPPPHLHGNEGVDGSSSVRGLVGRAGTSAGRTLCFDASSGLELFDRAGVARRRQPDLDASDGRPRRARARSSTPLLLRR
jgi:hypothetical protein